MRSLLVVRGVADGVLLVAIHDRGERTAALIDLAQLGPDALLERIGQRFEVVRATKGIGRRAHA